MPSTAEIDIQAHSTLLGNLSTLDLSSFLLPPGQIVNFKTAALKGIPDDANVPFRAHGGGRSYSDAYFACKLYAWYHGSPAHSKVPLDYGLPRASSQ